MDPEYYEIIDGCRNNLIKHTIRAFEVLPGMHSPLVLDAGCGSGLPTLALLRCCAGTFHAADTDPEALQRLRTRAGSLGLEERISIMQASLFDEIFSPSSYDLVLAEGLLNAVGFERGLQRLRQLVKEDGYIIIHDELKDDPQKRKLFADYGLTLLDSFELDRRIWWDQYYGCLENAIGQSGRPGLFSAELRQIRMFREDPRRFCSIYYILETMTAAKNSDSRSAAV